MADVSNVVIKQYKRFEGDDGDIFQIFADKKILEECVGWFKDHCDD